MTEAGPRVHEHARRLVRDADAARASVRGSRAIAGVVVLSASVTLGELRIVPALPKLLHAHPALELELRLEDRPAELVSEGVDIAVRAGFALPDTTSLVAQSLAVFQRVFVASPSYVRPDGAPSHPHRRRWRAAAPSRRVVPVSGGVLGAELRPTPGDLRLRHRRRLRGGPPPTITFLHNVTSAPGTPDLAEVVAAVAQLGQLDHEVRDAIDEIGPALCEERCAAGLWPRPAATSPGSTHWPRDVAGRPPA